MNTAQSSRRSVCLMCLFVLSLGACAVNPEPTEETEESPSTGGQQGGYVPQPVTHVPLLPQNNLGSGTIRSYVEDTELEPPFLTGSLFANGFSLDSLGGLGGGPGATVTDPIAQLGLGSGALTTLLLFDRSISMSDLWEGQPRWQVAGRAFLEGMKGVEESVTIGTLFFPQAAECEVAPLSDPRQIQFQMGTRFQQHWEAFPQNRFPSGGTPLGPAFEEANRVLVELEDYGILPPARRFRVAVITDGKPNCGTDEDRVLYLASEWTQRGIELLVIGLPGSEAAADFLTRLSAYGGSGYLAPQDAAEAEDSFAIAVR